MRWSRIAIVALAVGCTSTKPRSEAPRPPAPPSGAASADLQGRLLTSGELAVAGRIFDTAIDYQQVRIVHDKYVGRQPDTTVMTPQGVIFAPADTYQDDYSRQPSHRSLFIHEMAHVWQHQCGVDLISAAIDVYVEHEGDYDAGYAYALAPGLTLRDFNHEQQASIIADYAHLTVERAATDSASWLDEQLADLARTLGEFVTAPSCAALR